MRIRILGSAAGGGLPQWNCGCANCRSARDSSPHVRSRSQSSVAISSVGRSWFLLNASADVRVQLAACAELWPPPPECRGTPIAGCVLTDAEIDHASGLLQLREGSTFGIFSTRIVRQWLDDRLAVLPILATFAERPWTELLPGVPLELPIAGGAPSGLRVVALELGREAPRFVITNREGPGACVALVVEDLSTGGKLLYAPGVPRISPELDLAAREARCVLVDGTFWSEREGIELGITDRTASQMGHLPISGRGGTLAWLEGVPAPHRAYVHINNTNPVLDDRSVEYARVAAANVRVAIDGDSFEI